MNDNVSSLQAAAADAQRAYEESPGPDALRVMRDAQRAYDTARQARDDAEFWARVREDNRTRAEALIERVDACLVQPQVPPPEGLVTGWVSERQAQHLGMAPAVAGGAVWVGYEPALKHPMAGRSHLALGLESQVQWQIPWKHANNDVRRAIRAGADRLMSWVTMGDDYEIGEEPVLQALDILDTMEGR